MTPFTPLDHGAVRAHFSAHAGDYDRYAVVQQRAVEKLAATLAERRLPAGLCLDVGTGTGALARTLAGTVIRGGFVLCDLAHGMTCTAAGSLPGALACDADARHLPFKNGCFATVASSSVYQWVSDLPTAFAEVARVLRPGGCFALSLFGEQTLCELRDSHRRAVRDCAVGRHSHVQNFPAAAEVSAALEAAGLRCRSFSTYPDIDWHPDVPALLRQLKQIGAGNAAAGRPRGMASRQVMARMIELYEGDYRQGAGIPATYEVISAIAVKEG